MVNIIPDSIIPLFWDVDVSSLSTRKNSQYIMDRILELGNLKDDKWLNSMYSKKQIIEGIKNSKNLSAKTGNYYSIIYNIPKEEIKCLKKPFTQRQNRF